MPPWNQKWTGTSFCGLAGIALLTVQAYAFLDVGLVSPWLIGGGLGLLIVGAASWFYVLDDRRAAGAALGGPKKLPTADEYEMGYQEVESAGTDDDPPKLDMD